MRKRIVASVSVALALFAAEPVGLAQAIDDVAAFYSQTTVTLLVPSGTGGGYDRYGRLVARHIHKYIPGQPTIVPQNMPGAGGVVAANHLYNVSPKDGSVISIIQNGIPFKKLIDDRQVRYDIAGFRWLGSVSPAANIAVVPSGSAFKTASEVFEKELIIGGSGGTTVDMPSALNAVLGTKFKLIKGYKSTSNILLALERNEVDGLVGIDWSSFVGSVKGREADYRVLFQMGLSRHTALKDIPLIQESTTDSEKKAVLELLFSSFAVGRSFVTTVIPEERLSALRVAFRKTMDDEGFRKEAEKSGAEVNPLSPDEVVAIIKKAYEQPAQIIKRASEVMSAERQSGFRRD